MLSFSRATVPIGTISPEALRTFSAMMSRRARPVIPVGLDDHFERPAQKIEIVHVLGAQIDLQRGKHIGRREANFLHFTRSTSA